MAVEEQNFISGGLIFCQGLNAVISHSLGSPGMEAPGFAPGTSPGFRLLAPLGRNNPGYSWYSSQLLPLVQSVLRTGEVSRVSVNRTALVRRSLCLYGYTWMVSVPAHHTSTGVAGDGLAQSGGQMILSARLLWKTLSGEHWPETQASSHFIVNFKCPVTYLLPKSPCLLY